MPKLKRGIEGFDRLSLATGFALGCFDMGGGHKQGPGARFAPLLIAFPNPPEQRFLTVFGLRPGRPGAWGGQAGVYRKREMEAEMAETVKNGSFDLVSSKLS